MAGLVGPKVVADDPEEGPPELVAALTAWQTVGASEAVVHGVQVASEEDHGLRRLAYSSCVHSEDVVVAVAVVEIVGCLEGCIAEAAASAVAVAVEYFETAGGSCPEVDPATCSRSCCYAFLSGAVP